MFPKATHYKNRFTEFTFKNSKSSGNAMIEVKCEVVAPTHVEIGDDTVDITAVKTTNYWTVTVFEDDGRTVDAEKTATVREKLKTILSCFKHNGKPVIDVATINWDNPNLNALKGKIALTQMEAEVKEQRGTPSKKDLEEAKKKGIDPSQAGPILKDPVTGKQLVQYWPKIKTFFGLDSGGGY